MLNAVLCTLLPKEFGCVDFVNTYGTTVVYMTVQQFDSESLCEALQMCTQDSSKQIKLHHKWKNFSKKSQIRIPRIEKIPSTKKSFKYTIYILHDAKIIRLRWGLNQRHMARKFFLKK